MTQFIVISQFSLHIILFTLWIICELFQSFSLYDLLDQYFARYWTHEMNYSPRRPFRELNCHWMTRSYRARSVNDTQLITPEGSMTFMNCSSQFVLSGSPLFGRNFDVDFWLPLSCSGMAPGKSESWMYSNIKLIELL